MKLFEVYEEYVFYYKGESMREVRVDRWWLWGEVDIKWEKEERAIRMNPCT